jgi:hypothetical protein
MKDQKPFDLGQCDDETGKGVRCCRIVECPYYMLGFVVAESVQVMLDSGIQ